MIQLRVQCFVRSIGLSLVMLHRENVAIMSKNSEVAKIFREIAFILQTAEEKKSEPNTIFKIRSYRELQKKYKTYLQI